MVDMSISASGGSLSVVRGTVNQRAMPMSDNTFLRLEAKIVLVPSEYRPVVPFE